MSSEEKNKLLLDIAKKYPNSTLELLKSFSSVNEYISTGSIVLDRALGGSGFPTGKIVELVGMQGSGKTTLAASTMAQAQLKGYSCLFVDMEYTFNKEFAIDVLGLQEDKTIIARTFNGEEAICIMEDFIDNDIVKVVVLDSIPAFNPDEELTKSIEDPSQIGNHAKFVNRLMKRIVPRCGAKDILFIAINQPRDTIGAYAATTETGGRALKCWKAISVSLKQAKKIEENNEVVGQIMEFNIKKNKFGPVYVQGTFSLRWSGDSPGIDNIGDVIDLAAQGKIIKFNRGWYEYSGASFRRNELRNYLLSNPEDFDILVKQCFENEPVE